MTKMLSLALIGLSLNGCAVHSAASHRPKSGPNASASDVATPAMSSAAPSPVAPSSSVPVAESAVAVEKSKSAAVPAAPSSPTPSVHHPERGPVSAQKALTWLKHGNTRFVKSHLRKDGQGDADRTRLVEGQKPHTIVLSCSDSRVPPEVLFDQKLGEIFVIRTAGEVLDFGAIGSIEYALEHLGTNLILVLGHESCGAVKAALATLGGADAGSPALNRLVADLHPHLKSFASTPMSEGALVEGWANTEGVAKDLIERSQIVRDAVNTGEVKIQTALYHLGSGVVEFR